MLTSLYICFNFRNAHNNEEIYSLTGPIACGKILIRKSVTLLSSGVIYGIMVINKSIICIAHHERFLFLHRQSVTSAQSVPMSQYCQENEMFPILIRHFTYHLVGNVPYKIFKDDTILSRAQYYPYIL